MDEALRAAERGVRDEGPDACVRLLTTALRAGNRCEGEFCAAARDDCFVMHRLRGGREITLSGCARCGDMGLAKRVELAAWCQDVTAMRALGWRIEDQKRTVRGTGGIPWSGCPCPGSHALECPGRVDHPDRWLTGLREFGKAVEVRAALAVARFAVGTGPEDMGSFTYGALTLRKLMLDAIKAASDWLECPCDHHKRVAGRVESNLVGMGVGPARRLVALIAEGSGYHANLGDAIWYVLESRAQATLAGFIEERPWPVVVRAAIQDEITDWLWESPDLPFGGT